MTVVYIHPKANTQTAADTIRKVTQRLQSLSPDAPCLLMGDFNNCKLSKSLNLYQYVTCPTRKNKTLDMCYGSIKEAYKASPLPPLGSSDHCAINLIPVYRPMLKRGEVKTREIEIWDDESVLKLQGCFDCTDWSVFIDSASDIYEMVDSVCCYISFCVDSVIPSKHVKVYANNKPWVTSSLKQVLMKKHRVLQNGDEREIREATKEVRAEIKKAKLQYKNKIEERLGSNNLKAAWDGVKRMVGLQKANKKPVNLPMHKNDNELSEALNTFFSRFDHES